MRSIRVGFYDLLRVRKIEYDRGIAAISMPLCASCQRTRIDGSIVRREVESYLREDWTSTTETYRGRCRIHGEEKLTVDYGHVPCRAEQDAAADALVFHHPELGR